MKAADWTYEKLIDCTALELEQLIANLETAQNRAPKRCAATTAAIKRARFVLYACGNLLPQAATQEKVHKFTGEETTFRENRSLNKVQLLAIVQSQRVLLSRAGKHQPEKQRLISALRGADDAKDGKRLVLKLHELAQAEAANSQALFNAA